MRCCRFICLAMLALSMAGTAGACRAADSLESAACRGALDALQAQEAAALLAGPARQHEGTAAQAALAKLADLRQVAGRACLGGGADAPQPARRAQDPVTVPRVIVTPMPPTAPSPTAPIGPPPAVRAPPVTVTACDATGCWASDGSRLLRAGAGGLLGPRGRCRVLGTVLHCP
jgi:hypothetical protein